jgi:hypothetical protein
MFRHIAVNSKEPFKKEKEEKNSSTPKKNREKRFGLVLLKDTFSLAL